MPVNWNSEFGLKKDRKNMDGGPSQWCFQGSKELNKPSGPTIRGVLDKIKENLNGNDPRPIIPLGHGDPSGFPSFRTTCVAEDAAVDAVRSGEFNCYAPSVGLLQARRSIAEYLSYDHPYELSPNDIYIAAGAKQAIEIIMTIIGCPGANILLPRPGNPRCALHASLGHLEVRHFDLLIEQAREVDLDGVEALADDNTVAMVIVNPGNPCGSVSTYEHLQKIVETARRPGILVVADEAYSHLAFGSNAFVPMGVFGSTVPVLTIGSLSKRWMIPGWRLGWIAIIDPNGILQKHGIFESIKNYLSITSHPAPVTQGAVPQILQNTQEEYYLRTINMLREAAGICYERLSEIPCIRCPHKPEGSMFLILGM